MTGTTVVILGGGIGGLVAANELGRLLPPHHRMASPSWRDATAFMVGPRSMGPSDVVEVFDRQADRYDAWFDSPEGRALFRSEVEAVGLLLKDLPGPVLEVGVGTGRFAEALRVPYGMDPAPGVLRLARRRGVRVAQARGEALPCVDRTFGSVLLIVVLCFADPRALLVEARRVLRPDGAVIIADILSDSAWGRWYLEQKKASHSFYRHATFYTLEELREFLAAAGFQPARVVSTILQTPGGMPVSEPPYEGLREGASFVCLLARVGSP